MATEVWADLSQIQDEDSLRRMWQETEDFGRKKEIRARMYKIREQRLKDFYTTNETQQTEVTSRKHTAKTHTESIGDQGSFMTMKSKEIRDSESPTREVSLGRRGDSWSSGYVQESSMASNQSSQITSHSTSADHQEQRAQAVVQRTVTESGEVRQGGELVASPLEGGKVKSVVTQVTKDGDGGETVTRKTTIVVRSEPKITESVSRSSKVEQHSSQTTSSSYSTSSVQKSSSVRQVSSTNDFATSDSAQRELESSDLRAIAYTDTPRHTPSRDVSNHDLNQIRQREDIQQITTQSLGSEEFQVTSAKESHQSSHAQIVSKQTTDVTDRVESRRESMKKNELTDHHEANKIKNIDTVKDHRERDDSVKRVQESFDVNEHKTTIKEIENQDQIKESNATRKLSDTRTNTTRKVQEANTTRKVQEANTARKVSDTRSAENQVHQTTDTSNYTSKDNKEATTEQKIMNEIYKLDTYLSSQPTPASSVPISPQSTVMDNANWPVDQEFIYKDDKSSKPAVGGERGVPIKHPNNLEVSKEPTEGQYVTTYQQHYSRVSEDRDSNHQYFASTLRASPVDRSSPSPTKRSSSKGSLDRSTPDRKSRGSPNRKTPDADRRGSYTVERSPDSRRSITPGVERRTPEAQKETKVKRKLSSTQAKSLGKTRSSTPGASPTSSPTRTSRPRKTSSSDSDSEHSDATYKKSTTSLRQSKLHIESYKTDQNRTSTYTDNEVKDTKTIDIDGEKRVLTPSPTRHQIRENTPDYSSEGSITRELKISKNLIDRESKNIDSSPERSAFSPIKKFRTSPENNSSINMINEERKHTIENKLLSDIHHTDNTCISRDSQIKKISTDIVDDGFESQSPDSSPNRSRNALSTKKEKVTSKTLVTESTKTGTAKVEPMRQASPVKSKPQKSFDSPVSSPERPSKKPTTEPKQPESIRTQERKSKDTDRSHHLKTTYTTQQKYSPSPVKQSMTSTTTTTTQKKIIQKDNKPGDRLTRRTTTPRAETIVSRTPKADVSKKVETKQTTKTVKTIYPQRGQVTTTTVKTTKKESKPSTVKTTTTPTRNISTKVSTVQTTKITQSKLNGDASIKPKTDKSTSKPRDQDRKYIAPKLNATKSTEKKLDNRSTSRDSKFTETSATKISTRVQKSNVKVPLDDVKSDESLEDERPPDIFYDDIDEIDLCGSKKTIDINIIQPQEKLKPSIDSSVLTSKKIETTYTTINTGRKNIVEASKNKIKPVGKTPKQNKRKADDDSSSSSDDEMESVKEDSLPSQKTNLVKRDVSSTKAKKDNDFLSVIIQQPKSSRESSPEKSIPMSVTSDGGQTPRYADFITEPEDVEIFDASNLGPRKPIPLLDGSNEIKEESDEGIEESNVSVADRVSKYMEETNKTVITPLDSQKETAKAKEVLKAKQLFENITKQQVDTQTDTTNVREKRTLKKSTAEDTENLLESLQSDFDLKSAKTVDSRKNSIQTAQHDFIQSESKTITESLKTERRLSDHSPDILSKKAFFERKSQEQTSQSVPQKISPQDTPTTVPSYMRDTATAVTRKETIQREFSFTKQDSEKDRKDKRTSVDLEKHEVIKVSEAYQTDSQKPAESIKEPKKKSPSIEAEERLFKKTETYRTGNGGPKIYEDAKQKRAAEIEKIDTFKKKEAYLVCDEGKYAPKDKVHSDSATMSLTKTEEEDTRMGFDRHTESSKRKSVERDWNVTEKRKSIDAGEKDDTISKATTVTTSSKIEETVRRLSGADSSGKVPQGRETYSERRDSTKKIDADSISKAVSSKIEETVRRLSRTDSTTSPTRRPSSDTSPVQKEISKSSSSKIDETVRRLSRTDSTTRVSPTRRSSHDTSPVKKKEIEISQRTTEITRAGGKFGVTLRRTPSGSAPKNETTLPKSQPLSATDTLDIESIFDLELLEQLLAKAVGYDDRRRIRAQIRLVRRQIEETLSKGDSTINNESKQWTSKRQSSTTILKDVGDQKRTTVGSDRRDDSWIRREERTKHSEERKTSLKRDSPERSKQTKLSSPERRAYSSTQVTSSKTTYSSERSSPERRTSSSTQITSSKNYTSPLERSPERRISSSTHTTSKTYSSPVERSPERRTSSSTHTTSKTYSSPVERSPERRTSSSTHTTSKTYSSPVERSPERGTSSFTQVTSSKTYSSPTERSPERRSSSSTHVTTSKTYSSSTAERTSPERRTSSSTSTHVTSSKNYSSPERVKTQSPESRVHTSYTTTSSTTTSSSTRGGSPDRRITSRLSPERSDRQGSSVTTSQTTSSRSTTRYSTHHSSTPGKDEVTESITSSYGVGPTDDNGKPLFGLKALRRTNTNKSIDEVERRVSLDDIDGKENNDVRGSDGRPLFGLKALQVANSQGNQVKSEMQSRKTVVSTRSTISSDGKVSMTKQMIHGEMSSKDGSDPVGKITKSTLSYNKSDPDSQPNITSTTSVHTLSNNKIEEDVRSIDHDGSLSKRLLRGDSVKAIQSKFQQATDAANNGSPRSSFSRQSSNEDNKPLCSSLKQSSRKSIDESKEDFGLTTTGSTQSSVTSKVVTSSSTNKTSFLGDNSKVTGVQDILTRMRNADLVTESSDTTEDAEARSLLNKFLGASVLLQGMEAAGMGRPNSAALVSHVEKQRIRASTQRKGSFDDSSDQQERQLFLESSPIYIQPGKGKTGLLMAEKTGGAERGEEEVEETREVVHESSISSGPTESVRVTKKEVHSTAQLTKAKSVSQSQSPFAKFKQLERQNSAPSHGGEAETTRPLFRFTDPKLALSASTIKDRLLTWVQAQTSCYKNIKIENFSTSWSNGLAFCALIHHFYPDAFDYDSLTADKRRYNFELAFRIAEERGDIFPLLDVEDMVTMKKPDWKCVFTYVQSIHRHLHKSPQAI